MTFRRRAACAGSFAFLLAMAGNAAIASADQAYAVSGKDVFQLGGHDERTQTQYTGVQQLVITRTGTQTQYVARVEYDKRTDGADQHATASYTSTLLPSGQMEDGQTNDPDYLTVLDQPFAVQLDAPTLRDLGHVKRPVPFEFPSPITGAPLRGTLRRVPDATVGGVRAMGIAFEATGPLHGSLPDHPQLALAGHIHMSGTAYYAYDTALLIALDATLEIAGNLDADAQRSPVSILYQRSLRPLAQQAARAPTPRAS
ncbi:MAG TPA: hypothetical protein VMD91_14475 [Candidatus Sulfotelmatobacter sp.]|nr:hypothetical protein [Candidatus Sulfotelmatobacter sp.]